MAAYSVYILFRITAHALTCTKEKNELFDFDDISSRVSILNTQNTCYLVSRQKRLEFIENFEEIDLVNCKFLAKLQAHDGALYLGLFVVGPITTVENKKLKRTRYAKLWLVVKNSKPEIESNGYLLAQGDVIKFGKCRFRVKEINNRPGTKDEGCNFCDAVAGNGEDYMEVEDYNNDEALVRTCRSCLSENFDADNPLISPCYCSGRKEFIHYKCLQQSLMPKITLKSSESVFSMYWEKLDCDFCKKSYPKKLKMQNKTIELLEIPKPPGLYLVLEILSQRKVYQKGLHVIDMGSKNSISIGRACRGDLQIKNCSVSRNHAKINFYRGNFYLENTQSKFGTLVQIKRPILLEENKVISVQSHNSFINFTIEKPWTLAQARLRNTSNIHESFSAGLNIPILQNKNHNIPILPYSTGIPLSINNPEKLKNLTSLSPSLKTHKNDPENILSEYNQYGSNSSYESQEINPIDAVEEAEIASSLNFKGLQEEETARI